MNTVYETSFLENSYFLIFIQYISCNALRCPPLELDATVDAFCGADDSSLVGAQCQIQCVSENAVPQLGLVDAVKCIKDETDPRKAKWNVSAEEYLVCKVLTCSLPEYDDEFLRREAGENSVFYPDQSISYSCEKGFELIGAASQSCQLNEDHTAVNWSVDVPTCRRLECAEIDPIENGSVECSENNLFNSTCSVVCYPGYKVKQVGLTHARCTSAQTWDSDLSECVQMECTPLNVPQNVLISVCKITHGSSCKFSCKEGHRLQGESEITCENETWSNSVPTCVPIECPKIDENFANGLSMCNGYVFGSQCTFKCASNAILEATVTKLDI